MQHLLALVAAAHRMLQLVRIRCGNVGRLRLRRRRFVDLIECELDAARIAGGHNAAGTREIMRAGAHVDVVLGRAGGVCVGRTCVARHSPERDRMIGMNIIRITCMNWRTVVCVAGKVCAAQCLVCKAKT